MDACLAASALGSAMNRLSSVFDGASSGSSLLSNLVRIDY